MTVSPPAPARPHPGRPRSADADQAIRAATLHLLAELGYDSLTVEGVAARAGVGKPTIYRRFPSKAALVRDALDGLVQTMVIPDTGRVRDDLVAVVTQSIQKLAASPAGRIAAGLVAEMGRNPELAAAYRERLLLARRAAVARILDAGVARGELRGDLDREVVVDLLAAPPFYRALVSGDPLTVDLAERIVDCVLRGIAVDAHLTVPTPIRKQSE